MHIDHVYFILLGYNTTKSLKIRIYISNHFQAQPFITTEMLKKFQAKIRLSSHWKTYYNVLHQWKTSDGWDDAEASHSSMKKM